MSNVHFGIFNIDYGYILDIKSGVPVKFWIVLHFTISW